MKVEYFTINSITYAEQVDWYYPPLNPQENTCIPFLNNLNTRILEKDYFIAKVPCNLSNYYTQLPSSTMTQNNVRETYSCEKVSPTMKK